MEVLDKSYKTANQGVSTLNEKKEFDSQQGMMSLFALLGGLSSYVLNPDVWWLAKRNARDVAVNQYGVSPEIFDETMEKFEKARKQEAGKSVLKDLF